MEHLHLEHSLVEGDTTLFSRLSRFLLGGGDDGNVMIYQTDLGCIMECRCIFKWNARARDDRNAQKWPHHDVTTETHIETSKQSNIRRPKKKT